MLDFSSKFFLVSPSDPRYGPRIDEKISFFCLPSFLGRDLPLPQNQGKGALKKPKEGQKKGEERGEKEEELFSSFSHQKKKKRKFSLYSFSLFSLSLSWFRTKIYIYTQLTDRDIFFPLSRNNNRRKRREDRRFKPSSPPRRKTRLTAEPPWLCSRPRRSPRSRRAPTPA